MLVVIPKVGVQRCNHLHLHTQKGHQEAVQPSITRQCMWELGAHLELQRPVFGLHGILPGSSDLNRMTPVAHCLHPGGLGHLATNEDLRGVRWYSARDPVFWSRRAPRCGCPQEGRREGTMAGKPRSEARDTVAGGLTFLQGPLPGDPVVCSA